MHTAEREFLPLPDEKRVVVEQLPPFEEALRAAIARFDALGIASKEGSRLKDCADILNSTARGWVNRCVNVSGGIFPLLG